MVQSALRYYDGTWAQQGWTNDRVILEGIILFIAFKHNFTAESVDARLKVIDQRTSEVTALQDQLSKFQETLGESSAKWATTNQEALAEARDGFSKAETERGAAFQALIDNSQKGALSRNSVRPAF